MDFSHRNLVQVLVVLACSDSQGIYVVKSQYQSDGLCPWWHLYCIPCYHREREYSKTKVKKTELKVMRGRIPFSVIIGMLDGGFATSDFVCASRTKNAHIEGRGFNYVLK